jgi:hypothetical protein
LYRLSFGLRQDAAEGHANYKHHGKHHSNIMKVCDGLIVGISNLFRSELLMRVADAGDSRAGRFDFVLNTR